MMTPKTSWIAPFATDKAVVIGTEDEAFWKTKPSVVRVKTIDEVQPCETLILAEVLQKVEDPVATLKAAKEKAQKVVVVVPNEYSWSPQYQPLKNAQHKRFYDMMMLTDHLEEAGMDYVIEVVDYSGWSFLVAQITPHLNSEERRKRKRAGLQSGGASKTETATVAETGVPNPTSGLKSGGHVEERARPSPAPPDTKEITS